MNDRVHLSGKSSRGRWPIFSCIYTVLILGCSQKAMPADLRPKGEFTLTDRDYAHWAFKPVRRIEPPSVSSQKLAGSNPIDRFILQKLTAAGLTFSPPASNEALIRRITLDLIGLPPTPQEIDNFIAARAKEAASSFIPHPSALEALIDRLLASPSYGERWGRHWLDLARFAETDGFEHDAVRQHSWRYRDYVIKSFNNDKPYDRFIREQIAGDELWPEDPDAVTATGFNLLGPDMVDSSDQVQRRHNTLNDMTDTAALAFLGLTMGCARCHDHKFEPHLQRDYYAMQAFFTPTKFNREKPIPSPEFNSAFEAALKKYNEHPTVQELTSLEAPAREKIFQRKVAKLPAEAQIAHRTAPEQRNAEQSNLVLETADKVQVSDKDVSSELDSTQNAVRKKLLDAIKKLPKPTSLPKAMALTTNEKSADKTFILRRGEYSQPQDEVTAAFPSVLESRLQPESLNNSLKAGLQRTILAKWLASPANPLTARVMVNRIWQHHFGRGLVATPSEFGMHGQPPTHPELLDWLASEFIASGWSVKHMHKLMLLSQTYQQGSVISHRIEESGKDLSPITYHLSLITPKLSASILKTSSSGA